MDTAAFPAKEQEYGYIENTRKDTDPESTPLLQGDPYRGQDYMVIPDDMPFPDRKADNKDSRQYEECIRRKFHHGIRPTILSAGSMPFQS